MEKLGFDPEVSRGVMDGESGDDGKMEPASVKWWLPAGSAAGSSAGIVFTHGPILRFFAPQGRHVGVRSSLPNFTLIGLEVGFRAPKTEKNRILPI